MNRGIVIALVLVALLGTAGGIIASGMAGPVIGFPGNQLNGESRETPQDWSFSSGVSTFQLETRPHDPYSVNVWGVSTGAHLYVATRGEGTNWSGNVDANSSVRLRIDGALYNLAATLVTDESERERVWTRYVAKYEMDPADVSQTAERIYRLDSR